MSFFKHSALGIILISGLAACSEAPTKASPAAYVTNAEYVLGQIKTAKTSGIAFHVKPIRQTACKYMYVQFGKQNPDGQWQQTHNLFPGKDVRNNFGQDIIKDQIHFSEVDSPGKYGVLALGCEPYGGDLKLIQGVLATFDVEYGKLNYIGELALVPLNTDQGRFAVGNFSKFDVIDRQDFAREQMQLRLPELESYFQANIAEKETVKMSPEQQAKLDRASKLQNINKKYANGMRILEAIKPLDAAYEAAQESLDRWDKAHGYPEKDLPHALLKEREVLLRAKGRIASKIRRYEEWLKRNIKFELTEEYMRLEKIADRANKKYRAKYPFNLTKRLSKEELKSPEYKSLSEASDSAKKALDDFAKKHDM